MEFVDLVAKHKPLNLGQGFPDYAISDYLPSTLAKVASEKNNLLHQYTRGFVCIFTDEILDHYTEKSMTESLNNYF